MSDEVLVSGDAFKAMLKEVDPDVKIPELVQSTKTATVSRKNDLIKRIKFLSGLSKTGLKADEAYVVKHIPILPPNLRPASIMGGNRIEFADVNTLYRDSLAQAGTLKDLVDVLPPDQLVKERADAYAGVKALVGLGDAVSPSARGRDVVGLLKQIAGPKVPKSGLFHSKVLSKKQDFSGRGTIYSEPNLGFNEAAVPVDQLWTMMKFHILRDLAKNGYNYVDSEKAWKTRNPAAVNAFNKVVATVPVILNRAPTLMKSNLTAFYAKPIQGNTFGINPAHLPYFAGDYDGDAVSAFVPMGAEAIQEAKQKLLPQAQIHDYRKGLNTSMVAPAHEAILGSVHMTEPDMSKEVQHFKTERACLEALKAGKIDENTPVEIG